MKRMTRSDAEHRADRLWTTEDGSAVGQVRWRRRSSPRFKVLVCFTDGRSPEIKGASNVDWETAFAIAEGKLK